ncbi:MAG: TatD family hydrolase, partial [Candidatus Wildermuthbacteria bacterium]|nr:TatD family hydrolase [Candidatus Wildermuthbacteria bacterium]
MLIDTHGHVNFNAFKEDADEVLKRALENDTWVIMPGSQYSTSKRAVEIAERYGEGVYAAVGLHPIHLGESRDVDTWEVQSEILRQAQDKQTWMTFTTRHEIFDYEAYKKLTESKKVVAIGEAGLDYYRIPKSKTKREEAKHLQKEILRRQIDLSLEKNLPFIFHCRVAHDELIE